MAENENRSSTRRRPRFSAALAIYLAVGIGGWGTLWAIAWLVKFAVWD